MSDATADRIAIRDVLARYAAAVDAKDLDAVAACFTPDCAYAGSLGSGTIADALEALTNAMARYDATTHLLGASVVAVDGDTATADTPCVAHHVLPGGRHLTVAVRYADALTRTPTGWRIRRRKVQATWRREDPPTR